MKDMILENILGRFTATHYDFMEDGSVYAKLNTEYYETIPKHDFIAWMLDLMSTCIKEDVEILDYPLIEDPDASIFGNRPVSEKCLEFAANAGGDIAKWYFVSVPPVISEKYIGFWRTEHTRQENRSECLNRVIFKEPKIPIFNRASTIRHSVEMSLRCGCFI